MSSEGTVLAGIYRHEVGIRVQRARRFFAEGQKVQLVATYQDREMAKDLSN
jgi:translation initiation factor IF-3